MHFAKDMLDLRNQIDGLRRERKQMVDRLRRFGTTLRSDTAKMLSAMRKAMGEEHAQMREMRGDFNLENQRSVKSMMRTLHSECAHARRNWMGKKA